MTVAQVVVGRPVFFSAEEKRDTPVCELFADQPPAYSRRRTGYLQLAMPGLPSLVAACNPRQPRRRLVAATLASTEDAAPRACATKTTSYGLRPPAPTGEIQSCSWRAPPRQCSISCWFPPALRTDVLIQPASAISVVDGVTKGNGSDIGNSCTADGVPSPDGGIYALLFIKRLGCACSAALLSAKRPTARQSPIDAKKAELGGKTWDPAWDRLSNRQFRLTVCLRGVPHDVKRFCPRFYTAERHRQKGSVFGRIFSGACGRRAGLNPTTRVRHTEPEGDSHRQGEPPRRCVARVSCS